ncbi:MAG: lipoate--protein ligase family protein, partial [Firmicutes bacterium]|nr:lipoate--protein ligase family protein [Bacillota bacterium]
MKTIINDNFDPFYNLALEEYLLKKVEIEDDFFFLWRNQKCVIVGRNQNPFNEIDIHYALENNITIARRSTGGGTVYHDEGNINFTFITSQLNGRLNNYEYFLEPIIKMLNKFGIQAR